MSDVQAQACPACGATWECGGGCPIWGANGTGWRDASLFTSLTNSVGTSGADLTIEGMLTAQQAIQERRERFEDNYARVLNQTIERIMDDRGLSREDAAHWLDQRITDELALAALRVAVRAYLHRPLTGRQRTRKLWRKRGRR